MDGAGPVSELAAELANSKPPWPILTRPTRWTSIIERYGEVQGRFQELDGYALEGRRAKCWPASASARR
jgi:hypothetical protein